MGSRGSLSELRQWTEERLAGDDAHIIDTLTPLEVVSALRTRIGYKQHSVLP